MKILKNKVAAFAIAIFFMLSMSASITLSPETLAQVTTPAGTKVPSYAFLNIAPNPAGVGQTVTLNMYLLVPLLTSQFAVNFTIVETIPSGTTTTLGPFTSDATGGTYTTIVPSTVGNYTFQFFYGGQTLSTGVISLPSQTEVQTLVVQQEPIPRSAYPITPLPTSYWQTPVTAENVQNWYTLTGAWLGLGQVTFATTGGYNYTGNYNPYTADVLSGHVLWTKPWAEGGVAGGALGGNEQDSSFWSTDQYQPKYAPVVMNGIMYSQQFNTNMGTNMGQGIQAVDLYNGKTLWTINTTNTLVCGMETSYHHINQYGVLGPFLWTTGTLSAADTGGTVPANTGTQWNMWDAFTGHYLLSLVNGTGVGFTGIEFTTDQSGDLIGYFMNGTAGSQIVHPTVGVNVVATSNGPHLTCINMTIAIGQTGGSWQPALNTVRGFNTGYMWDMPVPSNISGVPIAPALALNGITNGAVVLTTGFTVGQFSGDEQNGWVIIGAMDANTGATLWIKNFTTSDIPALAPYTRLIQGSTSLPVANGVVLIGNAGLNWQISAINALSGAVAWHTTLTGYNGAAPNTYDTFFQKAVTGPDQTTIIYGLGGDIWCINDTNGILVWYTNTTTLIGNPGIETPYGIWPLWVFNCACESNGVAYLPVGHEYNPPLFRGAQLLALNMTNGKLIWSELDFSIESTEISYGILLSRNAYDNQIYAFGQGPSATTVSAPQIGVTTSTPVTITGTVTDVSAGASQDAVKANFPNGLPCVSDTSQSLWMEYVYQQQPYPPGTTGVPVTLSVIDANNNFRTIGTTTSDASGTYAFTWTPDIPGAYAVTANFGGSNSYYGSSAETHFYASLPGTTTTPSATPVSDLATTSMLELGIVAIIVVIIIIGAAILVVLLRKRP